MENKVDYGAQLRAIMNNYYDKVGRLGKADDLLPAAKARKIARLKEDTRRRFEEAYQAAEKAMQSDWTKAWKAANAHKVRTMRTGAVTNDEVVAELRRGQLRDDLLREMLKPETSVSQMLAEFELLGFNDAVEIVERYGGQYARDAEDKDDFDRHMAARHPNRVQAQKNLEDLTKYHQEVGSALALMRQTAIRSTQLDVEETNALQGQGSEGIE